MRQMLTFPCQDCETAQQSQHQRLDNSMGLVMAGEVLHEEREILGPEILDRHRAISTIMEELEAIDWYDQRIKASTNAELQAILAHNRDEEKEHASMLVEWLRRHDPEFDTHLRSYLFRQGPIRESGADAARTPDSSLAIGSLKG